MSDEAATSTGPATTMITEKASIEAYNRGPVTKFWEPASSCSNTMSKDGNMYYGWGEKGVIDTACYPVGTMKSDQMRVSSSWNLYYYSPAVCPNDWTRAATFTDGGLPHKNGLTTISVGTDTTAILCCPSGFVSYTEGHVCTSAIEQGSVLKYVVPGNDEFGDIDIGPVSTSSYTAQSHAYAAGIVVMFQNTDTAMLRSATVNPTARVASTTRASATDSSKSPSTGSTSANGAGMATSTGTANDAQPASSSGGLSTGAKVGMGVGIPLALAVGLLFGWFMFRRRKSPYASSPPGYDEAGLTKYAQVHEVHSDPPEIGGNPRMDVMPSETKVAAAQVHQRHELQ